MAGLWAWSTVCDVGGSRFDTSLWLLPWVFGGLWALSLLIHGVRWCLGLGKAERLGEGCGANRAADAATEADERGADDGPLAG